MSAQKPGLHPRNRHHSRYDLATLCQVNPELRQFLTLTPAGEQSVDFANPLAVKALNKALLAHFYAVANWDIPDGFLCPACAVVYPVRDGIPVMLVEEAVPRDQWTEGGSN